MERNEDITLVLAEEQTLLSRERTRHSYMQTGLAFTSVGLLIMKFLSGVFYFCAGGLFIILGALLIVESGKRYMRFRIAIVSNSLTSLAPFYTIPSNLNSIRRGG
jgi:uncharacterized membrane protein YidH (DUF202 family)